MKSTITFTLIMIILLLTACGSGPPAETSSAGNAAASALSENYPDALSIRNQLALGTLRLEDDQATAVTPEQAAKLLRCGRDFVA